MEVAPDAVEAPSVAPRQGFSGSDNLLVRGVARLPASVRAKLLGGFAVMVVLLVVVGALGLLAVRESNRRSVQLLRLQQASLYEQVLVTEAGALLPLWNAGDGIFTSNRADLRSALQTLRGQMTVPVSAAPNVPTLSQSNPALAAQLAKRMGLVSELIRKAVHAFQQRSSSFFSYSVRAYTSATAILQGLNNLASRTNTRASALVAANNRSFASSRNRLLGVVGGSVAVAIVLGLLLSWTLVIPLRRTEDRLAEIGAGDFSGRLEIANRDEFGRLAQRVNSTSDELHRVYRELELASEHKSQFLANMSHELRTPLNAIIGFSEVLKEQMFGELNERQIAYVNDVHEAGQHLLSLINDVLDIAKIEAGHMELDLSQVAISDLLKSAVSMHAERASRAGIELALRTEPAEITVAADQRRVRQIVFNLLSNAIKFTPPAGRIDVSARLKDRQVEIAVADTGPGIPPEDLEPIFEEFEQTSEGKQAEGTGLGLPLSRKLVELHGGQLWVESKIGEGSTFRFTLPVEQET
jgi:signal transduction histidine kinase